MSHRYFISGHFSSFAFLSASGWSIHPQFAHWPLNFSLVAMRANWPPVRRVISSGCSRGRFILLRGTVAHIVPTRPLSISYRFGLASSGLDYSLTDNHALALTCLSFSVSILEGSPSRTSFTIQHQLRSLPQLPHRPLARHKVPISLRPLPLD